MDVLFINPPTPVFMGNKEFMFPPSLMYLASYAARYGFTSSLLDLNLHLRDDDETNPGYYERYLDIMCERMRRDQPRVVGIGCLFSGQFPFVDAATRRIKSMWPEVITCTGGIHPTIFGKDILENCPDIDFVAIGEGEEQFLNILNRAKNPGHVIDCEGIGFRDNGTVVVREKTHFIADLNALPMPDYLLVDFDDYRHDLSKWHNPKGHAFDISVPLITSRSCPNRCNFCSMFLVMGPKFRARSAENVLEEIEYLYNEHGVRHFSVMDDNLTFSKKRTLTICDTIVKRGLDIQFDTPNGLMVRTLDQEVVDALVSAGWVRGSIAIESGSDYIRNEVVGKRLPREMIFDVLGYVAKYPHVYLRAYFIMGFPEDTPETLEASYAMIEEMHIDDIYMSNIMPFPGTNLFKQCVRDDLLLGINHTNIWRAEMLYMTGNKRFFIKPYAMDLAQLQAYRVRFDAQLDRKRQEARARRKALGTTPATTRNHIAAALAAVERTARTDA
ncbi:MAG: radical SAM protein [Desulfovibrionaceae bacterium]